MCEEEPSGRYFSAGVGSANYEAIHQINEANLHPGLSLQVSGLTVRYPQVPEHAEHTSCLHRSPRPVRPHKHLRVRVGRGQRASVPYNPREFRNPRQLGEPNGLKPGKRRLTVYDASCLQGVLCVQSSDDMSILFG